MSQLALPLVKPEGARKDKFLVGESNAHAVAQLEHWAIWPVRSALIVGPRKSGRSLLARTMARRSGGTMIDDADRVDEVTLFHAWNTAQDEGRPLFMVAERAPPEWQIYLPDLRSRMGASVLAIIGAPDELLAQDILSQLFERHELIAQPDVLAWVHRHIDRTHLAILRAAEALEEEASRVRNRRLSIAFARATLEAAGLLREPVEEN